jgi:hypothetical protein
MSQLDPPKIASARQSQPCSWLENNSAVRLLCQVAMVEDSLACTKPLQQRRPLLCRMEER